MISITYAGKIMKCYKLNAVHGNARGNITQIFASGAPNVRAPRGGQGRHSPSRRRRCSSRISSMLARERRINADRICRGSRLSTQFPGRPANLGRHAFLYHSERQIRDPFFIQFSDLFGQCVGLLSVFLLNSLDELLTQILDLAIGLGLSLIATNDADEISCVRF